MAYFSRLTDIVTCNLSSLLARTDDPGAALEEVLREMQEGVTGAERSVRTAINNVARIESEIGEQRAEAVRWGQEARNRLGQNDELMARQALERKYEVEDLIAGLEQQLHAALATRDHLQTMLNALQARLADARRRRSELLNERPGTTPSAGSAGFKIPPASNPRQDRIEAELAELKQQLRPK
jgi:phage shock protein A